MPRASLTAGRLRTEAISPAQTDMALTRERKQVLLQSLIGSLEKAKSVVFSSFQGLPVKEMSQLRSQIRSKGGQFRIAKKTLMRLATRKLRLPEIPDEIFKGPVGAVFGYDDQVAAAKALHTFAKTHSQITVLGGMMDGKILDMKAATQLSSLPEKNELLAKLVGSMKSPISGFHGVMHGVLRNFVSIVSEYQKKKSADSPAA